MKKYNPLEIEKKWQKKWREKNLYQAEDLGKCPKFYCLLEFPYPSGDGLHAGHLRSYSALDAVVRKKRMQGYNVLFPIGWDAFGLPTENYAIKTKQQPSLVTKKNIETFKEQIKSVGISFDWSREISTTDPKYYKWTQWIFLQLYKHGLAYKKKMPINWCPGCKIGLANEEVVDGKCERCGAETQKREKEQWLLAITKYADRLIDDLELVDYPERVKSQQTNWIGRSEGVLLKFLVRRYDKIFLATNNPAKRERIKKLLLSVGIGTKIYTPQDLGLKASEIKEEGSLKENAEEKARAYQDKVAMPIIGVDSGFFIKGEKQDPVRVRRNALGKRKESSLSQEEISQLMIDYYKKIADKNGGEVEAMWLDSWTLILPDGQVRRAESKREVILTNKTKGKVDIYLPVRSMYRAKVTGKYVSEQREEEELKELAPVTQALIELLSDLIEVFTTRPDTLFGATYLVLAPEHPLLKNKQLSITNYQEVEGYIKKAKRKSDIDRTAVDREKTGVELKEIKAINPAIKEEIPIFVADYVLAHYGTGAIMAVPAHDERDFAFAKKYNLPIREVVRKRKAPIKSYLMGAKNISDEELKKLQIDIIETKKNGDRKIIIPKRSLKKYEQLIIDRMETGYWNEYLGEDIVFLFKHKDGLVERIIFDSAQEKKIDKLAADFSGENQTRQGVWRWLADNDWYIDLIIHTENGVMVNSGEFSGLDSEEAKKKITEKVGGKFTTTYKLRDWIFSRQHYWGEPIPMVFCESCAKRAKNISSVFTFHAISSNPTEHWHPWLKATLERDGVTSITPQMPSPDKPVMAGWLQIAKNFYGPRVDSNSVVIGRSLGARAALKFAETHRLKKLILVCPTMDGGDKYWAQLEKKISDCFNIKRAQNFNKISIDYQKVQSNVEEIYFLFSRDDPYIPRAFEEHYRAVFPRARFMIYEKAGHFSTKDGFDEFPDLLDIIWDKNAGWLPIKEKQLPLELPVVEHYEPTDSGESPLAAMSDWIRTTCPRCGDKARRETDTMPNWAGSSWYFLRYLDPNNEKALADPAKLKYWLPVDLYNGGMEHTTLHLLYSRFWHKFLFDIGVVPTQEPYYSRRSHGMVLAPDGQKMSKSRGNVINPDEIIKKYGADTLRLYEMFMGPYAEAIAWSTRGVVGIRRFLEKIWLMQDKVKKEEPTKVLEGLIHQTIKKVTEDLDKMKFNTAIAALMILINELVELKTVPLVIFETFIFLLAPFAPHLAEELWENLGHKETIFLSQWPLYDEEKIKSEKIKLVIQINGKVRDSFEVQADFSQKEIEKLAKEREKIKKWLGNKEIKKIIFVPGRLVNIVIDG